MQKKILKNYCNNAENSVCGLCHSIRRDFWADDYACCAFLKECEITATYVNEVDLT